MEKQESAEGHGLPLILVALLYRRNRADVWGGRSACWTQRSGQQIGGKKPPFGRRHGVTRQRGRLTSSLRIRR